MRLQVPTKEQWNFGQRVEDKEEGLPFDRLMVCQIGFYALVKLEKRTFKSLKLTVSLKYSTISEFHSKMANFLIFIVLTGFLLHTTAFWIEMPWPKPNGKTCKKRFILKFKLHNDFLLHPQDLDVVRQTVNALETRTYKLKSKIIWNHDEKAKTCF